MYSKFMTSFILAVVSAFSVNPKASGNDPAPSWKDISWDQGVSSATPSTSKKMTNEEFEKRFGFKPDAERKSYTSEEMKALVDMGQTNSVPSNNEIIPAQKMLKDLGYYKYDVDGVWGKGCLEALRSFKRDHGLGDNNSWDVGARTALLGTQGGAVATHSSAPSVDDGTPQSPSHGESRGTKGFDIMSLPEAVQNAPQGKTQGIFTFEDIFPKNQQHQMGLNKLDERDKEALRAHVEMLIKQTIATLQQHGSAKETTSARADYFAVGGGHWIKENVGQGSLMILEDGTLWQIDPMDKIDAMLWLPISTIAVVRSASGSPGYDYLLVNTDDDEKAHAKYMGR